jgi:3-phosphoshikimate 1-carboxyvinyltransferase
MTVDIMSSFGVKVERDGYARFKIPGGQTYRSGAYAVEPDCSQAGYFWAAAAITGGTIKVKGISRDSRQGDVRFTEVLESMGCSASHEKDGIAVSGKTLSPIEVDMADMPDIVPTLAVVAAFAEGTTVIKNVAHLRAKESDRLEAVSRELSKIGIKATATDNTLIVKGGHPVGKESGRAFIETYNDHRIAMSFAVAGLVVPGIVIRDEQCVEKSFPDFWNIFKGLYAS